MGTSVRAKNPFLFNSLVKLKHLHRKYSRKPFSRRRFPKCQHQRCFWVRVVNFLQLLLHSFASEENRELLRVLLILVLYEGEGVPSILQISAWISFRHLRKKPPFLDHSRDGSANYGETIKYTTTIAKVHPDKVSLCFFFFFGSVDRLAFTLKGGIQTFLGSDRAIAN